MKYPFSPIAARGRLMWPNGARVALVITLNLEHWDLVKETDKPYYAGGPAILPDVLPGDIADFPNYTWREYGQRVGIWRLLEVFDELEVPASCTINASTWLERRPIVDAVKSRGWEIVAHNFEQGELLSDYAKDPKQERATILKTLEVYEQAVGQPAAGWLSSSLRGTIRTADLLAEQGLKFYCDLLNDDQPYFIETSHGRIVALPYSNEINDYTMLTRMGFTTDQFLSAIQEELAVLADEAARSGSGRMMNLGLHPHVSGRAYRVRAIREFLAFAKSMDGVWLATREAIADWYLHNHEGHLE